MRSAHRSALKAVEDLDDEQLRRRLELGPQPIAWQLWHIARWNDFLIGRLGGDPVWPAGDFRERWGWPADADYGDEGAGTGMADELAAALVYPAKAALLEYVQPVFERLERLIAGLDDDFLGQPWEEGGRATNADAALSMAAHDQEHIGMITALRGLIGLRGTTD